MPGCSVSIVDYLTIEIACHHTTVQRSLIAGYFDITVNALNARLRTCADRLETFPDLVMFGVNLLELAKQHRPDFENRVHPIWELSKRLIQSHQNATLEEDLDGKDGQRGALLSFLLQTDFRVNGHMPRERPKEDAVLFLPRGRKRKHVNEPPSSEPADSQSPVKAEADETLKVEEEPVSLKGPAKRPKQIPDKKAEDDVQDALTKTTNAEKVTGKGSRSEPYSEHELCTIYIARRIRLLDWDTISFALSRFRTPTIAILADARTAFDQYHDLIKDTLRLCCWPQDSMYLVSCAATECLAARDRGQWLEEIKNFSNDKGELYHTYMQKRLERIYRKSFETPKEKRHRRRRERILGYEGLSVDDYMSLPLKKQGSSQPGKSVDKVRKRRTKEEMQRSAEEKAAAKALLKANGLKANGEALVEKRKITSNTKMESEVNESQAARDGASDDAKDVTTLKKKAKSTKAPRRKYDVSEQEKLAFQASSTALADRRQRYDIFPEEQAIATSVNGAKTDSRVEASPEHSPTMARKHPFTSKSMVIGYSDAGRSPETRPQASTMHSPNHRDDGATASMHFEARNRMPAKGFFPSSTTTTQTIRNGSQAYDHPQSPMPSRSRSPQISHVARSPQQAMSISDLLGRPKHESPSGLNRSHVPGITGSFESAAASLFASASPPQSHFARREQDVRETSIVQESPKAEKPRSAMSLSALLN